MLFFILIPLGAAFMCLPLKGAKAPGYVTLAGSAAAAFWVAGLVAGALHGTVYFSGGEMFYCDPLSAYMLMVIALLSVAASMYSIEYMANEFLAGAITAPGLRYYYFLLNLFIFTMMLVPISNNLAMLWIAIEATTLVSALLVGIYRKQKSIEAAWKYIVLCTVGITFALLGTFLIYYAAAGVASGGAGEVSTLNWTSLKLVAGRLNPATVRLAFILVMVGYGTKAGLAPVHNWLPDAHSEAPTPVSALLSGILLNCAFYGIMRFAVIARAACGPEFVRDIMIAFGVFSIVLAGTFMLIQKNAKRLLAYSSIEHMGIICLSFGIGGIYGFYAALLHILNHALGKPLMFFVTGRIHSSCHSVMIEDVSGYLKMSPLTGALGFAGVMALAGAPPFNIFLSEFLMLKGLAAGAHWYIMAIFLGASGFVFYGLLKDFGGMFLGLPKKQNHPARLKAEAFTWWPVNLMMVSLGAGLLVLGLFTPAGLNRLITLSMGIIGA